MSIKKGKNQEKFEGAVQSGDLEMVKEMVSTMVNVEETLGSWAMKEGAEHAILLAVRANRLELVQYLLEKVPSCGFERDRQDTNICDIAFSLTGKSKDTKMVEWLNDTRLATSLYSGNKSPGEHALFMKRKEKTDGIQLQERQQQGNNSFFSSICRRMSCFGR